MERDKIYIFGAHSRARTVAVYLQYLYKQIHIEAYLYDNDEKNPESIEGIPVIRLEKDSNNHVLTHYPIYIGTRGIYHKNLVIKLKQMGFNSIYPVTQDLDLELRNQYLKKYYASIGRNFIKLDRLNKLDKTMASQQISATIYVVESPFDKPLQQNYIFAPYERKLYAGAVFVEDSSYLLPKNALRDDAGDNISNKNRQFCELTALYWMWKHAKEDIIGLAHYRRHFLFPEDWKERMIDNHVDVILPVPLYVAPSLEENYKSRHDSLDWNFMMQYLEGNFPNEYQEACDFFKGNLYSPCNMFVMKKKVLNDLCMWLFPILFKVAENGGEKESDYLNRYPGFISERLISLFFEINRSRFRVVYADKNFLA